MGSHASLYEYSTRCTPIPTTSWGRNVICSIICRFGTHAITRIVTWYGGVSRGWSKRNIPDTWGGSDASPCDHQVFCRGKPPVRGALGEIPFPPRWDRHRQVWILPEIWRPIDARITAHRIQEGEQRNVWLLSRQIRAILQEDRQHRAA